MGLKQTPSQTVGPFFAYGLTPEQYGYGFLSSLASSDMVDWESEVDRIRIEGRVLDGAGETVPDAMIEIWQADKQGRYAHPADNRGSNSNFKGFGRCGTGTDPANRFVFRTMKPGSIDGKQAPHLNVIVFMRGMLLHTFTRIYFSDEAKLNATDPVLCSVPSDRRGTLIATRQTGSDAPVYIYDIHMQGEHETVFFDA